MLRKGAIEQRWVPSFRLQPRAGFGIQARDQLQIDLSLVKPGVAQDPQHQPPQGTAKSAENRSRGGIGATLDTRRESRNPTAAVLESLR